MRKILLGLALAATFLVARPARAQIYPAKKGASDVIKLPTPAEVKQLQAFPTEFQLVGEDDSRQLVLTGVLSAGGNQDLSGDVQYEVADSKIVRVMSGGRVLPLANGATTITARFGDKSVPVKVTIKAMRSEERRVGKECRL